MLDWNDLQYLLALSQHGALPAAAEALGVNRTTVARRIEHLEQGLGTKLVDRVGRDLVLTDAGRDVIASAEIIEGEIQHLGRNVFGRDQQIAGAIRLTSTPAIGELLAPYIAQFQSSHPEVLLELSASMVPEDLATFSADVAVRLTNAPPDDMVGRILVRPRIAIYSSHETAKKLPSLNEIGVVSIFGTVSDWAQDELQPAMRMALTTNSSDIAKAFVVAGEAVSVLPCYVAEQDERLVRISAARQDRLAELWMLYHPRLRQVHRFRVFTEFLVETFETLRPIFEGQADVGSELET